MLKLKLTGFLDRIDVALPIADLDHVELGSTQLTIHFSIDK